MCVSIGLSAQQSCKQNLFALKQAYQSQESSFVIFCDALSALKMLGKNWPDHPVLIQNQDILHQIDVDRKENVFMWVPRHVGIRRNQAADRASRGALDKERIDELVPFSDLTPLTAKYIYQVRQEKWVEAIIVSNKFHEILPKLSDKLMSFWKTWKEDTVLNRQRINHSYSTHSFILKKEDIPTCVACNIIITIKHILIECADLVDVRKNNSDRSLFSLFQSVNPQEKKLASWKRLVCSIVYEMCCNNFFVGRNI